MVTSGECGSQVIIQCRPARCADRRDETGVRSTINTPVARDHYSASKTREPTLHLWDQSIWTTSHALTTARTQPIKQTCVTLCLLTLWGVVVRSIAPAFLYLLSHFYRITSCSVLRVAGSQSTNTWPVTGARHRQMYSWHQESGLNLSDRCTGKSQISLSLRRSAW